MNYVTPTHRKYPTLFFYAINGHMYLVKDKTKCKFLLEIAKSHNNENFNTSIVEIIDKKNIFEDFKYIMKKQKEQNIKLKILLNLKIY